MAKGIRFLTPEQEKEVKNRHKTIVNIYERSEALKKEGQKLIAPKAKTPQQPIAVPEQEFQEEEAKETRKLGTRPIIEGTIKGVAGSVKEIPELSERATSSYKRGEAIEERNKVALAEMLGQVKEGTAVKWQKPTEAVASEGWLTKIVEGTSEVLPQLKSAAKKAVAGAGTGAAIGGAVSAAGGGVGAVPGLGLGATAGQYEYWLEQSAGSLYLNLVEKGYDPQKARVIAASVAPAYAAIDSIQLGGLFKFASNPIKKKILGKAIQTLEKSALAEAGKQVLQEGIQGSIERSTETVAKALEGELELSNLPDEGKAIVKEGFNQAIQSAPAILGLVAGGKAIGKAGSALVEPTKAALETIAPQGETPTSIRMKGSEAGSIAIPPIEPDKAIEAAEKIKIGKDVVEDVQLPKAPTEAPPSSGLRKVYQEAAEQNVGNPEFQEIVSNPMHYREQQALNTIQEATGKMSTEALKAQRDLYTDAPTGNENNAILVLNELATRAWQENDLDSARQYTAELSKVATSGGQTLRQMRLARNINPVIQSMLFTQAVEEKSIGGNKKARAEAERAQAELSRKREELKIVESQKEQIKSELESAKFQLETINEQIKTNSDIETNNILSKQAKKLEQKRDSLEIKIASADRQIERLSSKAKSADFRSKQQARGRTLTNEQQKEHVSLIDAERKAQEAYEAEETNIIKNPYLIHDDATILRLNKLDSELKTAIRNRAEFENNYRAVTLGDIVQHNIAGNLLSAGSIIANLFWHIPTRIGWYGPKREILVGIDALRFGVANAISKVKGQTPTAKRLAYRHPVFAKSGIEGAVKGTKEAARGFLRGTPESELRYGEPLRTMSPSRMLRQGITGEEMPVAFEYDSNGNKVLKTTPFVDRLLRFTAGVTAGWPEFMLRLLPFGDTPFKTRDLYQLIDEQIKVMGLSGNEAKAFRELQRRRPKDEVMAEALVQVLQNSPEAYEIPYIGRAIKETARATKAVGLAPYVNTPLNLLWEITNGAVPAIPLAKAVKSITEGKTLETEKNIATALTGMLWISAASTLIRSGIIKPRGDESEKEEKLKKSIYGFSDINLSALFRKVTGGDATEQPDDEWTSLIYFGIPGAVMSVVSTTAARQKKSGFINDYSEFEDYPLGLTNLPATGMSFMRDFGMTKGVSGVLEGLSRGDLSASINQWIATMTASFAPRQVQKFRSADDIYIRNTKEKDFTVESVERAARFALGDTKIYPPRRDILMRPEKKVPDESLFSPWVWNSIYALRIKRKSADKALKAIESVSKKIDDPKIFPEEVNRIDGVTLKESDKELLAPIYADEHVRRFNMIKGFENLPDNVKAASLKEAWQEAKSDAITIFKRKHPEIFTNRRKQ